MKLMQKRDILVSNQDAGHFPKQQDYPAKKCAEGQPAMLIDGFLS